ncbi:MAG TPA: antibiotic biosynthesis monooxygenase [Acidimicrobiia bacterium]
MSELIGIARFSFKDGDVEEYKRLSVEAMEIVRTKDPGTLEYSVYLNEDESEAIVIERFRSSEALIEHGANLAELSEKVLKTGSVEGEVLGEPSQKLTAQIAEGPVRIFKPFISL